MKFFLLGLCSCKGENPYIFRVPDIPFATEIAKIFDIDFKPMFYCRFLKEFFNACKEAADNEIEIKIEFAHTITTGFRDNIIYYLAITFGAQKTHLKEALADITDFTGREGAKIITKLEPFNKKGLDLEPILLNLKLIQESCKIKTYGELDVLAYILRKGNIPFTLFNHKNIHSRHSFIPKDYLCKELSNSYCEIEVDCSNYNTFEEASVAANYAAKLALIKHRGYAEDRKGTFAIGSDSKVIFTNIQNLSTTFMTEAETLRANLESKYIRNLTFCYFYDEADCLTRFGFGMPKYIRVISDLHVDYPKNAYYYFNFGTDFVINCGDIADDCLTAARWINANMTRGLIVPGNHMGYTYPYPEENGPWNLPIHGSLISPKNTRTEQLRDCFQKLQDGVSLLNKTAREYNGVVFLCTTLHTNFSLYGEKHKEECAGRAMVGINDYRRIYKTTGNYSGNKVVPYTVQDTIHNFEESIEFLECSLRKYKNKPVVVVTHFAPLPHCVHEKYAHDTLNAYFANDLSWMFEKYKNIRLWCHGHIHTPVDFVYKGVRVIACPFGDGNENGYEVPFGYGKRVSFDDIKSQKEWESICGGIEVVG